MSRAGDWFHESVAVVGPLASSTEDLARFLDVVANAPDPDDELTSLMPAPSRGFASAIGAGAKGLVVGLDETEWRDAAPDIVKTCEAALAELERLGAKRVNVRTSLARYSAQIGYLSIGAEGLTYGRLDWKARRDLLGEDLRLAWQVSPA